MSTGQTCHLTEGRWQCLDPDPPVRRTVASSPHPFSLAVSKRGAQNGANTPEERWVPFTGDEGSPPSPHPRPQWTVRVSTPGRTAGLASGIFEAAEAVSGSVGAAAWEASPLGAPSFSLPLPVGRTGSDVFSLRVGWGAEAFFRLIPAISRISWAGGDLNSTVQQNLTWFPVYGGAPVTREIPVPSDKEEIIRHLLICVRKAISPGQRSEKNLQVKVAGRTEDQVRERWSNEGSKSTGSREEDKRVRKEVEARTMNRKPTYIGGQPRNRKPAFMSYLPKGHIHQSSPSVRKDGGKDVQ
uniref:Uncharacterized protein n=1 Tax=Fagus sylvatica TaxID=28930 RepID=A0A2N9IIM4_FAGSY